MTYVIIVAGGKGERMGGTLPKQFLPLAGKPVLMHTIEAFCRYDATMSIIVVLHPEMRGYWQELCTQFQFDVPITLVSGGATRFHSVKNGLSVLRDAVPTDLVMIHDAVRPFVSPRLIDEVLRMATDSGAAIPTIPLSDSLRFCPADGTSTAIDRNHYRAVQTPQAFRVGVLQQAYEQPYTEQFTDDASVVENLGKVAVKLTLGDTKNFKLTTPIDFALARTLCDNPELL